MPAVPELVHRLGSAISEDPGHAPGFSFAALKVAHDAPVTSEASNQLRDVHV
jgi:hypothetical protein